jgi:cellulose synthase/poly-beta-1,6-N-acetylglucosamine synthase-like glycosyltransferase
MCETEVTAPSLRPSGACAAASGRLPRVTAVIPAHNEAVTIGDTIRSLLVQTLPLERIIVVDDHSTDGTAAIASALGATVTPAPGAERSRIGALNHGLALTRTDLLVTVDADTIVAPDAVEKIAAAMADRQVAAAGGMLQPRHIETVWERGRYIMYLTGWEYSKPIEDLLGWMTNLSGCFAVFRTEALRACGGWSSNSIADDQDLTWRLQLAGHSVHYVADARCQTLEPTRFGLMLRQRSRWRRGFFQNLRHHRDRLLDQPLLGAKAIFKFLDQVLNALVLLVLMPFLTIWLHPAFLMLALLGLPMIAVPALYFGARRGELGRVILCLPCFWMQRVVSTTGFVASVWSELIMRQTLRTYEKGR